ncbi:MAG: hypothetical protein HYZ14_06870 [Bacteroidetes bacterium]|nr:hypothetical protein [Bacteroidota bacterium]
MGTKIKPNVALNFRNSIPVIPDGMVENDREIILIEVKHPQFERVGENFKNHINTLIKLLLLSNLNNYNGKISRIIVGIAVQKE